MRFYTLFRYSLMLWSLVASDEYPRSMLKYTSLCCRGEGKGVENSHSIRRGNVRCCLGNQFWSVASVLPTWKFPLWEEGDIMSGWWSGSELSKTLSINSGFSFLVLLPIHLQKKVCMGYMSFSRSFDKLQQGFSTFFTSRPFSYM